MPTSERAAKFKQVAARRQAGLAVILEDVHDPMNAAAIMRTCDAFGVQDIRLIFQAEKPWSPRRVGKAASSANKWLSFKKYRSTAACLRALARAGYETVAMAISPDAENLYDAKLASKRIALVVGNEHRGLSPAALALADHTVVIPMHGMVQSLNVSVSAALAVAEITRQRSAAGGAGRYRLSPRGAAKLARDFARR